jgi:hypothetical protein
MNVFEPLLCLIIGFSVAVPSSMAGLGGGFLIVPILILIFQLPAQNAIAISLVAICGTTISATIAYARQKRIDYILGLLYDLFDIPGVIIGAYLTTFFPSNLLAGIVGVFIMSMSIILIMHNKKASKEKRGQLKVEDETWKRRKVDSSGKIFEYIVHERYLTFVSSFAGGLVTGLAGLGGGITDTATMILLGVPPHIAVASSEFAMALTNGTGVIAHGLLNNILFEYALPITLGTIIGAQLGSYFNKCVRENTLRKILAFIAFFVGLRMALYALF